MNLHAVEKTILIYIHRFCMIVNAKVCVICHSLYTVNACFGSLDTY